MSLVVAGAALTAKKRKSPELDSSQNLMGVVEPRHVTEKRLRDRHDRNDLARRMLEVEHLALRMLVQRLTYRTDDTTELLEQFAEITQNCGYCKVPFLDGSDDFVIGCTKCNIKICKIHVGHGFLCNCPDLQGFLSKESSATVEESVAFAKFEQVLNRYGEALGNRVWHKKLPGTNPVTAGFSTNGLLDDNNSESCSNEGESREGESPQNIVRRDIKRLMKQRFLKPKPKQTTK